MDQINGLLTEKKFRAIKKTLFSNYGADPNSAASKEGYLSVLRNMKYNFNELDFVEFLNFFETLVDIINSGNESMNKIMKLDYLKEAINKGITL